MTEPRRIYARPRTFEVECPKCTRLHVVASPRVSTATWDHKRSRLTCSCGKVWIVGLALWDPGKGPKRARPLDQIPSRETLQQLRGIVAGPIAKRASGARPAQFTRSLAIVREGEGEEGCSCQWHRPPLQFVKVKGSEKGCPVHGGEGSEGS